MAVLKGPFFSLSARGSLAKTLVYACWKGIQYVRQYVVPANPKTEAQQAQRGYFTEAVSRWHSIPWTTTDKQAWDRWALYDFRASMSLCPSLYWKEWLETLGQGFMT